MPCGESLPDYGNLSNTEEVNILYHFNLKGFSLDLLEFSILNCRSMDSEQEVNFYADNFTCTVICQSALVNGSALRYMFQLLQGRKTSRLFSVSETL